MPLYNQDHGNLEGRSDDDHTQYLLLAGRAGGQTLYGGTDSSDDLTIAGNSGAWSATSPHQVIIPNSQLKFTGQTTTDTNIVGSLIHFNDTITHNTASAAIVGFVFEPTINYAQNQVLSFFPAFFANPTFNLNAGGISHAEWNLFTGFLSRAKYNINHSGATSTIREHSNYISQPWLTRTDGQTGTVTITTFANVLANKRILFNDHVSAGHTVTDFVGFKVQRVYSSGTVTNNIGLDIDDLTVGTNLYGIRVAEQTGANSAAINLTGTSGTTRSGILFGGDTNLYRSAASTLKTDDSFVCADINTGSGAVELAAGTYTPTGTAVTNVSAITPRACQYMRVGNTVTVSGQVDITPTANNSRTTFALSLPIASNFANSNECGGSGYTMANTAAGHGLAIYADATNNRAECDYFETHSADTFTFTFTYQIT